VVDLAGGKPAICHGQHTAPTGCLVHQLRFDSTHSGISYGAPKCPAARAALHSGHVEVVDHEVAIPSRELGSELVMDLAVGLSVPFQKNGAPRSGERIEKLNFLLRAAEGIPNCALADVPALVQF
jgi:hypothetical protein